MDATWTAANIIFCLLAMCLAGWNVRLSHGIECFCHSRRHPCQKPICEGLLCLVGFENDVDLVQTCAKEEARLLGGCARKFRGWRQVCTCDSDRCNTFSYLREKMTEYDESNSNTNTNNNNNLLTNINDNDDSSSSSWSSSVRDLASSMQDQDSLVDREAALGMGGGAGAGAGSGSDRSKKGGRKPQVILLLVVIPLGVGALAVFLIFVNYHCKMC